MRTLSVVLLRRSKLVCARRHLGLQLISRMGLATDSLLGHGTRCSVTAASVSRLILRVLHVLIMLKHVLSLVLVLIKRSVLIRERRAEARTRCLIGTVAIRTQVMMAPRPSLPPIVGALHRTHPLPFPSARLPLRRFLTARAPNLFTFLRHHMSHQARMMMLWQR